MDGHDCLEWLEHREHEWVETHGLDCGPFERCYQQWWICAVCRKEFTAKELDFAVETGGNQAMKRPNDCCKSYTIHATDGIVILAETPDRLSIEITVDPLAGEDGIHLSKAQFQVLCNLDSNYDGLEVNDAPEPEAEPEEEDEDVTVA